MSLFWSFLAVSSKLSYIFVFFKVASKYLKSMFEVFLKFFQYFLKMSKVLLQFFGKFRKKFWKFPQYFFKFLLPYPLHLNLRGYSRNKTSVINFFFTRSFRLIFLGYLLSSQTLWFFFLKFFWWSVLGTKKVSSDFLSLQKKIVKNTTSPFLHLFITTVTAYGFI